MLLGVYLFGEFAVNAIRRAGASDYFTWQIEQTAGLRRIERNAGVRHSREKQMIFCFKGANR